jgi:hypothetical protein
LTAFVFDCLLGPALVVNTFETVNLSLSDRGFFLFVTPQDVKHVIDLESNRFIFTPCQVHTTDFKKMACFLNIVTGEVIKAGF